MKSKILEIREQGNLRFSLTLNTYNNGDINYGITEQLIKGNNLLSDNAILSTEGFDTIRKARNKLNRLCPKGFIMPINEVSQ